ncbi:glycosyltransferase family 2 protein [Frigidibacter sp. SD6-1]|uniref:glycosyltransferase family 2 protein n=1 Tax=Frigidibacter sp. SD6-1 TaxID=3032581 RepID=UPI0024DF916E|nr:glycosyltransferase family 2 protein [Frigidibacter sp. SD6-1]
MDRRTRFLKPILTGRQAVKYRRGACLWLAAALFFWSWWLQPGHILGWPRFLIASACLFWLFFLQAYFVVVFLNARRTAAPTPEPGDWRVAMIVTKTPGEPLSLLKRTLTAMLVQDYPHDTWLADEDPSPETIAWCAENGVRISTRKGVAAYHQPVWPRRTRCKEGNLAYFYDHYGYEAYDIVAQLDADHVPQPGYLREMLRPFADPKVGYVSAPSICNANSADSWAARTRLDTEAAFHGALQCGYTGLFTSICIGSHYAVRTAALKAVGGLGPELAEDHSTSMVLAAGGWQGVHAIDAIAFGDGPANVADLATQEFQWSRSLVTLLLSHTGRYLPTLPARLKFSFLFGQSWYVFFAFFMLYMYLSPIYALTFDARFADVTYWAFVLHSAPTAAVLTWFALEIKRDGLFRPYNGRIFGWEKMLFIFLQWPWVFWGVLMAARDRMTGKFVDFRVTPKGEAATKRLPTKVVAIYTALATGALLPLLFVDAQDAQGFYLLSALNGLIYTICVAVIVLEHLRANGHEFVLKPRTFVLQAASVASLVALMATATVVRGKESLYALTMGMEPFQLVRAQYLVSGAGISNDRLVVYEFDLAWN